MGVKGILEYWNIGVLEYWSLFNEYINLHTNNQYTNTPITNTLHLIPMMLFHMNFL